MKRYIGIGLLVYSTLFSWLGALIQHGDWFGFWSTFLGIIGCFFGIWAGYKIYRVYVE